MSKRSRQLREQNILDNVIVVMDDMPIKVYKNGVMVVRRSKK